MSEPAVTFLPPPHGILPSQWTWLEAKGGVHADAVIEMSMSSGRAQRLRFAARRTYTEMEAATEEGTVEHK